MTQTDVLRILKKRRGKWMTPKEIHKAMPKNTSMGSVRRSMQKLVQWHLIERREFKFYTKDNCRIKVRFRG